MDSLREKAARGVKWTSFSAGIVMCIEFVRIAILAHLLLPSDFGLVGMIMVIVGFAQTFSDMGISNAIIYKQDSTKEQLSSLYWLNVFSGALIFVVVVALSPVIVQFYNEPKLLKMIPFASLGFLIAPFGQQFNFLLQKELRFKALAWIEIASSVTSLVVAIVSAMSGHGAYSIIWGTIAGILAGTLLLIAKGFKEWRPSIRFSRRDLKGYLSFGLYQMGERSVNYFSANVDYLFVGRFLGADLLGIYMIAYQLVVKPLVRINPILTKVAFPVFSRRQKDDAALRRGYLALVKLISFITFPVLFGLLTTSKLFIPVVYGQKWELAIPLVQILVVLGMIKSLSNPSGSILLAKGRADIGFKWNLFVALLNTVVFFVVARHGVFHVAWSWVFLGVFYFLVGWVILKGIIGLLFKEYMKVLVSPFVISACMSILVWVAYLAIGSLSGVIALLLLVLTGIASYAVLVLLLERSYAKEMWKLLIGQGGG